MTATVDVESIRSLIASHTRRTHEVRARWIADELFGDYMLTNLVVLGAAYQSGTLPITADAIESAIELNGVAVELNKQAFRYGRAWVVEPSRVIELIEPPETSAEEEAALRRRGLRPRHRAGYDALMAEVSHLPPSLVRALAVRVGELIHHADRLTTAQRYVGRVLDIARREEEVRPGAFELTGEVVRSYFKLLAYKDEYEVARLYLAPSFADQVAETFTDPVSISYNLSPPAARAIGRTRKLALGPWFRFAFWILRSGRRIRGTWCDPFRGQASRKEERALIRWYEDLLDVVNTKLSPGSFGTALDIAALPDGIRGYEGVKHRNAEKAQARAEELRAFLDRPRLPLSVRQK